MSAPETVQVEAAGETVGEARWAALHELERRYPALDRARVEFVVLTEGERGLLGVGYEPARVLATLTEVPAEGDATACRRAMRAAAMPSRATAMPPPPSARCSTVCSPASNWMPTWMSRSWTAGSWRPRAAPSWDC